MTGFGSGRKPKSGDTRSESTAICRSFAPGLATVGLIARLGDGPLYHWAVVRPHLATARSGPDPVRRSARQLVADRGGVSAAPISTLPEYSEIPIIGRLTVVQSQAAVGEEQHGRFQAREASIPRRSYRPGSRFT